MNKYDIDKLLVDNEVNYPDAAEDERSVQRRCHEKKPVYFITPKRQ